MKLVLYLPDPIEYKYVESEELIERRKAESENRLLMYPYGVCDEIQCEFKYNEILLSALMNIKYDKGGLPAERYSPPVVVELDVHGDKIPCTLWDVIWTEEYIKCKFQVTNNYDRRKKHNEIQSDISKT